MTAVKTEGMSKEKEKSTELKAEQGILAQTA